MAGKVRHLLNRDGRYFARLVIPADLRPFMDGKTELRTPLGPDYRTALRKLPGAVAVLQHDIALAERHASKVTRRPLGVPRYPLAATELASHHYKGRLALDEDIRNAYPSYANDEVDADLGREYRDGFAGKLTDDQLEVLVGREIERFRWLGNTDAKKGSDEWRILARALCVSEYEALCRVAERNEGDFAGKPSHPMLANAVEAPEPEPPVSLTGLLDEYLAEREAIGKGREARRRWTPVFGDLRKFIGHDDVRRLTKKNLLDWKDARLQTLSAKTVGDVYLSALRTVLTWAVDNDRLESNVAEKVRVPVAKKARSRERGFTTPEAVGVLKLAKNYTSPASGRERPETAAAKRWAPILCAFTGARIAEITQLRKQDVRIEGETAVIRITPDAGTVKTDTFRDVPLHRQIVDLGFLDFVNAAPDGPLFYQASKRKAGALPARMVAGRISQWLQNAGVVPQGVSPNHGWRHRLKTVGRELGIADRVLDAIQGHAARTAGDDYGDVSIIAKKRAIGAFPAYALDP